MAGTEGAGDESLISNLFLRHTSGDVEQQLNKTLNQAHLPAMVCGLTGRTLTHGQVSSEIV